ncbi:bifunctional diguanylate cyclase/phosphodiesterase [Glaciimonas sp. PCH181]|uniref:putative bifunctional diguanylate cyclase/phosphodiesterase n=1 Tax=Glaciimonas sp. PCH181 TaxID=2133943 RepID=UPI000D353B6F|nr:EAL domain-containing protein [Glaciimonas sp. PCH181]PUA18000.1 histidine kinase [Glaciimonas sp. PCH181]
MNGIVIPALSLLSFAVAVAASYVALMLVGRVSRGRPNLAWIIGGGIAMGTGMWAMQVIGMLGFYLPIPVTVGIEKIFLSWCVAIITSGFALFLIKGTRLGRHRLVFCGVIIGLGIAEMYFLGVAAIEGAPRLSYDSALFTVAVAVAIVGAIVVLSLAFRLRGGDAWHTNLTGLAAAIMMALAIMGMQTTWMAAARFSTPSLGAFNNGLDHNWLVYSVAGFILVILAFVMLLSFIDIRSRRHADALRASLKSVHSKLAYLGTHDALTSLPNRSLLNEKIAESMAEADAGATRFAILHINIDRLKTVNEALGRTAGDQVLNAFVLRIRQTLRPRDMLARLSGDDFVVLSDVAQTADAGRIAANLIELLGRPLHVPSHEVHVTVSIGISVYPNDGDTAEALLASADIAMSYVKQHGRNNYHFFTSEMHARNRDRVDLESGLRPALLKNEFRMFYQPKVDIASGKIVGVEALLRWQHPEYGLVSPSRFIPLAEESGLIVALGDWVMEAACQQSRQWQELGLTQGLIPLSISVNLSAHQFLQRDLVESTQAMLVRHGIPAAGLILELTEGSLMGNPENAIDILRELTRRGVRVSIDDFGTGYSSLSYLRRFPLSEIKIDRSFVQSLETNQEDRAIVRAIVTLAHSLQLTVVAEGVAKVEQLRFLRQIGCDQYQGFLFSEPVPADVMTDMLRA